MCFSYWCKNSKRAPFELFPGRFSGPSPPLHNDYEFWHWRNNNVQNTNYFAGTVRPIILFVLNWRFLLLCCHRWNVFDRGGAPGDWRSDCAEQGDGDRARAQTEGRSDQVPRQSDVSLRLRLRRKRRQRDRLSASFHVTFSFCSPLIKARFPLPELTARVNGPSWRVTGLPVKSASGNRANSSRQLGYSAWNLALTVSCSMC